MNFKLNFPIQADHFFAKVSGHLQKFGLALLTSLSMQAANAAPVDIVIGELALTGIPYYSTSVTNPNPIDMVFQLSLTQPTGPNAIPIDVYFGVILPNQSVISWVHDSTPNATITKMSLGLLPLASNVMVPTTTGSHALAGFQISRHTFTPQDQVGLYFSFCIVVATGKTPYDPRNWLTTGATMFVATP